MIKRHKMKQYNPNHTHNNIIYIKKQNIARLAVILLHSLNNKNYWLEKISIQNLHILPPSKTLAAKTIMQTNHNTIPVFYLHLSNPQKMDNVNKISTNFINTLFCVT